MSKVFTKAEMSYNKKSITIYVAQIRKNFYNVKLEY